MKFLAVGNICKTQIEHQIYGVIAKTLDSLGCSIIKIHLFKSGSKNILQIILEKNNGEPVNINDCTGASRAISTILDTKDDIIDMAYNLEVMSAGINRPLTRPEDFTRFITQRARIKVIQKIDGIATFYGEIIKCDGKVVTIKQESSLLAIELSNISDASLDLIEKQDFIRENKNTPEYKKKFQGKRVSDRKLKSNNDRGIKKNKKFNLEKKKLNKS